jgi:hypothetical protein
MRYQAALRPDLGFTEALVRCGGRASRRGFHIWQAGFFIFFAFFRMAPVSWAGQGAKMCFAKALRIA